MLTFMFRPPMDKNELDTILGRGMLLKYTEPTHRIRLFDHGPDGVNPEDPFVIRKAQFFDELGGFMVTEDQATYWLGHGQLQPTPFHLPVAFGGELQFGSEYTNLSRIQRLSFAGDKTHMVPIDHVSRPYTPEEMTDKLLHHFLGLAEYWEKVALPEKPNVSDVRQRLEGLLTSILSTIDGVTGDLPAFTLVAQPHPQDKDWHEKLGTDYWPPAEYDHAGTRIQGVPLNDWTELHTRLYQLKATRLSTAQSATTGQ